MVRLKSNKAQPIVEYAVLLGAIVAVLVGMNIFLQRGHSSNLKDAFTKAPQQIDFAGVSGITHTGSDIFSGNQYIPYYTEKGESTFETTSSEGTQTTVLTEAGGSRTASGASSSRTGNQVITNADGYAPEVPGIPEK